MTTNRQTAPAPSREREIFLAALGIADPATRSQFLDTECQQDAALRRRLEELLAGHVQIGSFLDTPAFESGSVTAPGEGGLPEKMPERIGRYKLLQIIGEGGCGVVYMAEQEEPVRRRVAVKVIKAGMDTRSVIARFEAERQALALMDHPNIAKVLDGGATDSGRPYFVMELVRGMPITEFCNHNHLTVRERLELFIKTCHAVQHAHQKGIIHRDVKPSNILVTLHDGVPLPKVIDFGVAKATQQRLTSHTLFTAFEQLIGTPAYMSPEQAEMSGLDIDTRTDIYSLGVLLYELLTGKTPFDGKELVDSGLDTMRRTIREREPLPPSTRMKAMEMAEAMDLAKHRQEQLPALIRLVRGDLDWIVLKAVAKDRTRRYESASDFAHDIERYLSGEVISARPPSRAYRLQKFIQRNRLLVATGTSMLIVLVLATGISTWQAVRATRAERDRGYLLRMAESARQGEVKQRQRAEKERAAALRRAYNSDMNLVPQALRANNYGRVVDLLDRHRPNRENGKNSDPDLRQWEWRYFWDQARSEAAFALPPQSATIEELAISSDGRFLASADRTGGLVLSDLFRRTRLTVLRLPQTGDGPFAFSHRSNHLAVAIGQGPRRSIVKLWDVAAQSPPHESAVAGRIQAVGFPLDDSALLLFCDDKTIQAWDGSSAEPVLQTTLPLSGRGHFRAKFSLDAKWLAIHDGARLRIFDTASGTERSSLLAFEQGTATWSFSPDGDLLAVSPNFFEVETAIKLFNTFTGKEVGELAGHQSWVPSVTFSSDGKRLISAGADQTVRIWDVGHRHELAALRGHRSEVNCVAISADGKTIISGCKDGTLFGWAGDQTEQRNPYEILPAQVTEAHFLPDSHGLLCIERDGNVVYWPLSTRPEPERISAFPQKVEHLVVSPDGTRVYATGGRGQIDVLDWNSRTIVTNIVSPATQRSALIPVAVVNLERTLVTIGPEMELRVWDTRNWQSKVLMQLHSMPPPFFGSAQFPISRDQRLLLIPSFGPEQEILDLTTGQIAARLNVENLGVGSAAFSPDRAMLAFASRQGTVVLWDLIKNVWMDGLRGHLLGVHGVAFSPDGERLASASAKNEAVKLWDVTSRHEVATFGGEGSLFNRVEFSPDGTVLLAVNTQGQVHLWRAPSLAEIEKAEQTRQDREVTANPLGF